MQTISDKPYLGSDWLSIAIFALAFACVCGLLLFASRIGVEPNLDGLNFKSAHDIASGAVWPGQEFSQYGTVFHAFNAAVLKLCGGHFVSLKIATALHYTVALVILFLTCRQCAGVLPAAISVVMFVGLAPLWSGPMLVWASAPVMALTLAATWLLILSSDRGRSRSASLAGGLVGLILFIKVSIGVVLMLGVLGGGVLAVVLRRSDRRARPLAIYLAQVQTFTLGWAACVAAIFSYLAVTGSLRSWYHMNVVLPQAMSSLIPEVWFNRSANIDFVLSNLFPINRQPFIWTALPTLVALASLATIGKVIYSRHFDIRIGQHLTVTGMAGASWAQYYPDADAIHVWWAAVPMLPVLAIALRFAFDLATSRLGNLSFLSFKANQWERGIAVSCLIATIFLIIGPLGELRKRAAEAIPLATPSFRGLRQKAALARDLDAVAGTIAKREQEVGPVRLAILTTDPLFGVLPRDPTNWSHSPTLQPLYLTSNTPTDYVRALRDRAQNRLLFTKAYTYLQPAWRPILATSEGGYLLEPNSFAEQGDLPPPTCGQVETHVALAGPEYGSDWFRFFGYLMPPVRARGPVALEILVVRRREEGPNSVILDASLGAGEGIQIRRHRRLGDAYYLTEVREGRADPLVALNLEAETLHHVELRRIDVIWQVYLDGKLVGTAQARPWPNAVDQMVTLGAGRRFIDSFVGEVVEWRVTDRQGCDAGEPSAVGVAAHARARTRIFDREVR